MSRSVTLFFFFLPVSLACRWTFDSCQRTGLRCNITLHRLDAAGRPCGPIPRVRFLNRRGKEGRTYSDYCFNEWRWGIRQCYINPVWCNWGSWKTGECTDGQPVSIRTRRRCCHPLTGDWDLRVKCTSENDRYTTDTRLEPSYMPCPTKFSIRVPHETIEDPTITNLVLTISAVVAIFVVVVACQCISYHVRKASRRQPLSAEVRDQLLNFQPSQPSPRPSFQPSSSLNFQPSQPSPRSSFQPSSSLNFQPSPSPRNSPSRDISQIPSAPPQSETVLPPSYEEAAGMQEPPPPRYDVALKLVT